MNEQQELIPGTNRDLALSQYFTPPELAQRVVEWAMPMSARYTKNQGQPVRVLEPSAGNGALVRPLVDAGAHVTAVELDERYIAALRALGALTFRADFLKLQPPSAGEGFDLVLQNTPYEEGQDVQFILHALKFAPRVVGIFQAGIEYGVDRFDDLWSKVRPTRILKLKRRWFKSQDGKGGLTNYVVLELVALKYPELHANVPHTCTIEWF